MMLKRIGRIAICALLICCFLINMFSLSANASPAVVPTVTGLLSVPGVNVVAGVLIGLGVLVGVATTDWDGVVRRCAAYLQNERIIDKEGNFDIYAVDGVGYLYGVAEDVIEKIREWLFVEEVVTETASGAVSYNGVLLPPLTFNSVSYNHAIFYSVVDETYFSYHTTGVFVRDASIDTSFSGVRSGTSNISFRRYVFDDGSWVFETSDSGLSSFRVYGNDFSNTYQKMEYVWSSSDVTVTGSDIVLPGSDPSSVVEITADTDLTLEKVASSDKSVAEGYEVWAGLMFEASTGSGGSGDDNKTNIMPVPLLDTLDHYYTLSQEDAWNGVSDYTQENTGTEDDTQTEVITGTFADTAVGTFINSFIDALTAPFEWLANTLLEGIKSIFVPDTDFLTEKLTALRTEFGFADSLIVTAQEFGSCFGLATVQPPVITVDLSAYEGEYDFGDEAVILDMSFYERYKPTGDALLSAFMWVIFLWRLFVHLPGIIAGVSADVPFMAPSREIGSTRETGLVLSANSLEKRRRKK